jgi:hypothetical protein
VKIEPDLFDKAVKTYANGNQGLRETAKHNAVALRNWAGDGFQVENVSIVDSVVVSVKVREHAHTPKPLHASPCQGD